MSEAKEVAELALKADKTMPMTVITLPDGREFVAHRNDFSVDEVTADNAEPVHKPKIVTQAVQVQVVESFIEYTNRMKNFDTVIFADIGSSTMLGVIDYHQMPGANMQNPDAGAGADHDAHAELAKHSVTLKLPFSLEWQTWMGMNDRLQSHKAFATFLEHNSIDILPLPPRPMATTEEEADAPSTLLELTRSLQVVQNVNFNTSIRHGSYDRVDFQKQADRDASGSICQLPLGFHIRIPVYFGARNRWNYTASSARRSTTTSSRSATRSAARRTCASRSSTASSRRLPVRSNSARFTENRPHKRGGMQEETPRTLPATAVIGRRSFPDARK